MLAVRPPTPDAKLHGEKLIALRQIGPKSAFLTNRIGSAYARHPPERPLSLVRKKRMSKHYTKVSLKLTELASRSLVKPVTSPTPDTNAEPVYRSLSCGFRLDDTDDKIILDDTASDGFNKQDDDRDELTDTEANDKVLAVVERGVVPTAPESLAPEGPLDRAAQNKCERTLDANCELERTVAVDEMREAINMVLKGLHADALCTWRQMVGAVILLLMQRNIPMDVIRLLTQDRYKVFDVKGLYYGDFVGKRVYVEAGTGTITGTVCAYHAFDGFCVEHTTNGEPMTLVVDHNTKWAWAGAGADEYV